MWENETNQREIELEEDVTSNKKCWKSCSCSTQRCLLIMIMILLCSYSRGILTISYTCSCSVFLFVSHCFIWWCSGLGWWCRCLQCTHVFFSPTHIFATENSFPPALKYITSHFSAKIAVCEEGERACEKMCSCAPPAPNHIWMDTYRTYNTCQHYHFKYVFQF